VAPAADIDRLIEEGLNRYGTGDLDGALLVWEEALAIDPDNAQANSYVDYVRLNYEVLRTDSGLGVVTDGPAPFGIEDEPEYIIEITRGEIGPGDAPMYMDPTDEGWFIEEEQTHELYARTRSGGRIEPLELGSIPPVGGVRTISADLPPKEIELEADEPPELELAPPAPQRAPSAEVTFDSATREYGSDPRLPEPPQRDTPNEFLEEPSSFRAEATPGFSNLETEVRKRDLGFVQPTQEPRALGPAPLEVRLRTPSAPPPAVQAGADLELGGAGRTEPTTSELGKTARGIPPVSRTPAPSHPPPTRTPTEDDLIASLPSPRRVTPLRGSRPPPPTIDPASRIPTRELPEKTRLPAAAPADRAETKQGDDEDIALPSASTRDLGIREMSMRQTDPIGANEFAVSAPTRDLGLRMPDAGRAQPATKRPPSVFPDEDAPTRQSDARQIREDHSTQKLKALNKTGGSPEGTRKDIVLPFDPIDARTAQILEAIEPPNGEPANEVKEDRTRRRITALIERSTAWSAAGELDKAVAAVDLALSEDPDTALAQKLIHRNRDAIMNIFQAYLGDLERQPQLARPLHELSTAAISPRAAFLLSRIDGTLTIDEILDVSGMPRLEAYRHLCQLFLRGILR
jgi:tetratricopeptide (TPR) repeat protein